MEHLKMQNTVTFRTVGVHCRCWMPVCHFVQCLKKKHFHWIFQSFHSGMLENKEFSRPCPSETVAKLNTLHLMYAFIFKIMSTCIGGKSATCNSSSVLVLILEDFILGFSTFCMGCLKYSLHNNVLLFTFVKNTLFECS